MQESSEKFWENEALANQTRRQPIDKLEYISVDNNLIDKLSILTDEDIIDYTSKLQLLAKSKILNLTGITNTELKLQYGAANLTTLSEYDQNYTKLVSILYRLGARLHEIGEDKLAIETLENGIDLGSDVSGNYILLATLYNEYGMKDKIDNLMLKASTLNTINKNYIMDTLSNINSSIGA